MSTTSNSCHVLVCVTCDTLIGDAANPPPVGRCPNCHDTRLDIVTLGGGADGLRSAASGNADASLVISCGQAVVA